MNRACYRDHENCPMYPMLAMPGPLRAFLCQSWVSLHAKRSWVAEVS
jgi:hypothetical protein